MTVVGLNENDQRIIKDMVNWFQKNRIRLDRELNTPSGGSQPSQEHYVCKIRSPGIPARSGVTVNGAMADIQRLPSGTGQFSPSTLVNAFTVELGATVERFVWNLTESELSTDSYHVVTKDGFGQWWVGVIGPRSLGYGGLSMSSPGQFGDDLGLGWDPIDEMDQIDYGPINMTLNVGGNGRWTFGQSGLWQLSVFINLEFDEAQQGRSTNLRLFNITDSLASDVTPIFVGRNTFGTTFAVTFNSVVTSAQVGKSFRLEIGGGSTFTNVVWNQQAIDINQLV